MLEPLFRTSGPIVSTEVDTHTTGLIRKIVLSKWCMGVAVACTLSLAVFLVLETGGGYVASASAAVIALAIFLAFFHFTRFCPRCSLLLSGQTKKDARWCEHCGHLISQNLLVPINGRLNISNSKPKQVAISDPVFQLVNLILFVLADDEVDIAVLQPEDEDYRFFAMKDGIEFELEPPPRELHDRILAIVKSVFEVNDSQDRSLFVHGEQMKCELIATIARSEFGESLTIRFSRDF